MNKEFRKETNMNRFIFVRYDFLGIIPIAVLFDRARDREVKIPRFLYEENRKYYKEAQHGQKKKTGNR
jgi:hypothetical protein